MRKSRVTLYVLLLTLCLFFSAFFAGCSVVNSNEGKNPNILYVHYIDVGQGDSILVEVNDKTLLIDGGSKDASKKVINYLKSRKISRLDYLIATHPHEDHIGSLSDIVDKFNPKSFYAPKVVSNTESFKSLTDSLKKKKIVLYQGKAGVTIDLGENTTCTFLAPNSSSYDNLNNYSIVIKLTYKDSSFLFTGDAEKLSENEILKNNSNLKAQVLKAGHHGSRSSSSSPFLDAVAPSYAIISCGSGNDYGHPHKETLKAFEEKNISVYRTDTMGTIVFQSDGYKLKILTHQ